MTVKSHAIYIHWPFCRKKCPYCDFNSHVRDTVDEAAWHEALLAELRWYHSKAEKRPISSIFFGGGTPSLMPPFIAEALISETERLFGFTDTIEITLEANPTSTEMQKLSVLKQAGVNRVSLGVQSLTNHALEFLGREHSASEALKAVEETANLFEHYSFDLIYGLPKQSLDGWQKELKEALRYAGKHLSLYQLTIEPNTQFFHHHQSGKLVMPEEEVRADFYEATQNIMNDAGLPAYEISNHAKAEHEARHNVHIWRGGSYLGIGPGAHGRMDAADGTRCATVNLRSPEKWLSESKHGGERLTPLTAHEILEEKILMGLRLNAGLSIDTQLWPSAYLEALCEEGLIYFTPSHITPTKQGQLLLNQLTSGLINIL